MKRTTKIIALLICLALTFTVTAPAFAAPEDTLQTEDTVTAPDDNDADGSEASDEAGTPDDGDATAGDTDTGETETVDPNADESGEELGEGDFTGEGLSYEDIMEDEEFLDNDSYDHYLSTVPSQEHPIDSIVLKATDYTSSTGEIEVYKNYEGYKGDALFTGNDSTVSYTFNVKEAGLYSIELEYYPIEGRGADIERRFTVNGKLPFYDAGIVTFSRVWQDANEITQDNRGNDVRPTQIEAPQWCTQYAKDPLGYYIEPYYFYLEKGENTLDITATREPVVLGKIEIKNEEELKSYAEVLESYNANNYQKATGYLEYRQAESAYRKSTSTLTPQSNRSSASVVPYDASKIKYNTIGGTSWNASGQWISWELDVPEDGLYTITLKYRQNAARGTYTCRELTIDGEIPFKEVELLKFPYANKWVNMTLGDDTNGDYLFYLTKGTHVLKLEANMGDLAGLLIEAEESITALNVAYRKILMITGTNPDLYRNYQLDVKLPGVMTVFGVEADRLTSMSQTILSLTGKKGDRAAVLDSFAYQLNQLIKRPDKIPETLESLKSNISSLGTWMTTASEMPLELDYIAVASEDNIENLDKAEAGFFAQMVHEFRTFFASFVEDYNTIGNYYGEDEDITTLKVWITTGRDQANVLKQMIDDTFVPLSDGKTTVNLQLVTAGNLLPAVVAGMGPDVVLQVANGEPVNYAIRGAVTDVSQFEGYDEVAKRFNQSSITPLEFEGGVYALPETETFNMLFYRTDILESLGIAVPQTWEDVSAMIPDLIKANMTFGLPSSTDTFAMFLYQYGGQFYTDDGTETALNSEASIKAFKKWTKFFIEDGLDLTYDFLNRFRIGEMPIAVANYSMYNTLAVFAPEIRGKWDFQLLPGTPESDTVINRSGSNAGTVAMIMEASENKDAAWEFLKWWTDTQTQVSFGRAMESIMGSAARYNTANLEAVESLPWSTKDLNKITEQWSWVKGIPQLPGSYFTERHLTNAFRKTVYNKVDPRETLLEYLRTINEEITNKREEFGLITAEDLQKAKQSEQQK